MKKPMLVIILLCGLLSFSGSAFALPLTITIDGSEIPVGAVDEIFRSAYIFEPNDENEVNWIQSQLGAEYIITDSYSVESNDWTITNQNGNAYALELGGTPEYFFIWLATNPTNPPPVNAFLYNNLEELAWAVVDISIWGFDPFYYFPPGTNGGINIGRVSHLREVGGTPVPEPATMLLLGFGLIGLAVAGRRSFRK